MASSYAGVSQLEAGSARSAPVGGKVTGRSLAKAAGALALAAVLVVAAVAMGLPARRAAVQDSVPATGSLSPLELVATKDMIADYFIFTHVGNPKDLDGYLKYPLGDLLQGPGTEVKGILVMYVMPKKEWGIALKFVQQLAEDPKAKHPAELVKLHKMCQEKMEKVDADMKTLHRIRILSPLDFSPTMLSIWHRLGQKRFEEWFGHTTYDAPKLVDSIMRLRSLGNDMPVFRFDINVICSRYTEKDMKDIKGAVAQGVKDFKAAVVDPLTQSFVLSQHYTGIYAKDSKKFTAWLEAYSTRANPALLATPAMVDKSQWKKDGSWGSYTPSPKALQAATDEEAMVKFYGLAKGKGEKLETPTPCSTGSVDECAEKDILRLGNTYIGANPTAAVISGAALATGPGVTLDMPPFLHTDLNIMWIDDHLLDKMSQEVMGTKRHPRPQGLGTATVVKARYQPRNIAKYTLELYMPTLTYGIVMDKWVNAKQDSYLLKYEPAALPKSLQERYNKLMPGYSGSAQGVLSKAMQGVRSTGTTPEGDDLQELKKDLWADMLDRLGDVYYQWGHLPEPKVGSKATPTFASLWATGRVCKQPGLESYCSNDGFSKLGRGLVLPAWDAKAQKAKKRSELPKLTKDDLQPAMATKLDGLVDTALKHLQWVLIWPDVVQAVRDENVGLLPSDMSWREPDIVPKLGA